MRNSTIGRAAVLAALLVALGSCADARSADGPPVSNDEQDDVRVVQVFVGGTTVNCILADDDNGMAIDCDWEGNS